MPKPTQTLKEEHAHISKVIEALKKECYAIQEGKKLDKDFFMKSVDFIKNYADSFHHAREEDILFAYMREHANELHCNPIEQMLVEHKLGRDYIKKLIDGIKERKKEKIARNTLGYCELLQDHIFKEDNILYPMADEVLSNKEQKLIRDKFNKTVKEEKFSPLNLKKYLDFANLAEKRNN